MVFMFNNIVQIFSYRFCYFPLDGKCCAIGKLNYVLVLYKYVNLPTMG